MIIRKNTCNGLLEFTHGDLRLIQWGYLYWKDEGIYEFDPPSKIYEAFKLLFLRSPRHVFHEELIRVMWENPDSEPENTEDNLRTILSRLRCILQPTGWTIHCWPTVGYWMEKKELVTAHTINHQSSRPSTIPLTTAPTFDIIRES